MFKINGQTFDVGVISCTRSVKKEYKYNLTTEDGVNHSEIKAVRRVYTLTVGNINQAEYDALFDAVNTYDEYLPVTLPYNQEDITFDAAIETGGDAIGFVSSDGTVRWDGLSITFTDVNPVEVS